MTPDRLRVLLLVDQVTHDAGTERQVAETIRRMDPTRFEVHLCCLEDSPRFQELSRLCEGRVFPLDALHSLQGLRGFWAFRQYVLKHRIQIVQAFMLKTSIFGVLAMAPGWSGTMITSRLNTGYWYTPALLRMMRFLNRFTDRVVANSEGAKSIAVKAEGLPPEKVDVIYQGVDMDVYSRDRADPLVAEALGIPPSARVVGIVANLRPVKDIPLFLRAAAVVAARISDAVFVIAGKGALLPELETLASSLGIRSRVFFTKGEGRVIDYLARFSVACLTSQSEGFSNAILEYMALGLPVVATDVGGNAEAIVEGETGYLVADRTPEAFAAPVIRLLEDDALRASMGAKAIARCRENFEIDRTIRVLEDYFQRVAPC